jgi:hypothetical protein
MSRGETSMLKTWLFGFIVTLIFLGFVVLAGAFLFYPTSALAAQDRPIGSCTGAVQIASNTDWAKLNQAGTVFCVHVGSFNPGTVNVTADGTATSPRVLRFVGSSSTYNPWQATTRAAFSGELVFSGANNWVIDGIRFTTGSVTIWSRTRTRPTLRSRTCSLSREVVVSDNSICVPVYQTSPSRILFFGIRFKGPATGIALSSSADQLTFASLTTRFTIAPGTRFKLVTALLRERSTLTKES